jgi:hypothetical protein
VAELHLRDGRVLSKRVEFATGEPENPVPRSALIDKFVGLAQESLDDARGLAERILRIDDERDVRGLGQALRAERR